MSFFSTLPRSSFIPTKEISLQNYDPEKIIVLDVLEAKYHDIYKKAMPYSMYVVDESTTARLDLISWVNYGTVDFWWVIGNVNGILNPLYDLPIGKRMVIPNRDALELALRTDDKQDAVSTVDIL